MVTYRAMSDGDLMQIHEDREVGRLGVKLAPDTQNLFVAAPGLLEALRKAEYLIMGLPPAWKMDGLDSWKLEYEKLSSEALMAARAAIAQAEGKER